MNYLAHAYLSFQQPDILAGNMMSDYVKGNQKFNYSVAIQKGITLHRLIDQFTDQHEATQTAKIYFKPVVGLYAGAFVDVVYDHFLALDTLQFANPAALQTFATKTYETLHFYVSVFPNQFNQLLPHMQSQNWLYNYQFHWGIEKSFQGVVRRAKYLKTSEAAYDAFIKHYEALQNCYHDFFPSMKGFVEQQLMLL